MRGNKCLVLALRCEGATLTGSRHRAPITKNNKKKEKKEGEEGEGRRKRKEKGKELHQLKGAHLLPLVPPRRQVIVIRPV